MNEFWNYKLFFIDRSKGNRMSMKNNILIPVPFEPKRGNGKQTSGSNGMKPDSYYKDEMNFGCPVSFQLERELNSKRQDVPCEPISSL